MIRFLILCFLPCLLFGEEEIIVKLETSSQLIPITISPIQTDDAHSKALEEVFRFDMGNNGMTTLVERAPLYTINLQIHENTLNARIFSDDGDIDKTMANIPLTGSIQEDRRTIHNLSDIIHKELFGADGIASTHFLYTLRKDKESDVWEADYDGHNARQITQNAGYCVTPCYLPPKPSKKPTNYFFVSYKTGQPKIYLANTNTDTIQRFVKLSGNQLMPTMSRQRDQVAFISDITGNPDLFLQAFDSEKGPQGKPRQLYTSGVAVQGTPSFSPDGTRLAFVSNKDGTPRIYILTIPPEGTPLKKIQPILISKINRDNTAPSWSPDGTKIAYCAKTKGIRQIWIYDFLKKEERQLTQGSMNKENPTWAPNSLHLIYNTTGTDQSELYLINLRQPKAIKISSGEGDKRFPSF